HTARRMPRPKRRASAAAITDTRTGGLLRDRPSCVVTPLRSLGRSPSPTAPDRTHTFRVTSVVPVPITVLVLGAPLGIAVPIVIPIVVPAAPAIVRARGAIAADPAAALPP